MKIKSVMGKDVSLLTLEDVMDVIINAPTPVIIDFVSLDSSSTTTTTSLEMNATTSPAPTTLLKYEMGTPVTIIVQQPPETRKSEITIEAKVGDNLRKTLLSNPDIELYRGFKKKLGNCGGGGQCGFCAVEVMDTDEEGQVWGKRSDYEATKIGKNGNENTRLACLNNIVGPATVRTL
jgi:ferredoxin